MLFRLDKGACIEATDFEGRSPLHYSINSDSDAGQYSTKLLLERGADIDQAENTGLTPIHVAAVSYTHLTLPTIYSV